ncbi:hypothetical protein [Kitasatospora sp. NPDC056181]|uniref:hypothetical protein n=1 Tax=Kitasatospora sp. NPDC056181 TaxID=3345737 RepID=UPI0035DAD99A
MTLALPQAAVAAPAGEPPAELVLPAAPRGVPARDQLFVAGDTGLLHAREGSDQLLWTRYDNGATTDTGLRLPAPVPAGLDEGQPSRAYRGKPDNRYGTGSDTAAVPVAATGQTPAKVDLYDLATGRPAALGSVELPAGQTYYGTYGRTVLAYEGTPSAVTGWFLHRLDGGSVSHTKVALPAGATLATSVHDGDQNSVILRYRQDDLSHSVLVDVVTGALLALPDEQQFDFSYDFRLGKGVVLRSHGSNGDVDHLDRAQPQTVLRTTYVSGIGGELRLVGDRLVRTESVTHSSGDNRGRPVFASAAGSTDGSAEMVLESADAQLLPAPDGSLIVVGTEHLPAYGQQRDTKVYRLTAQAGAKPAVAALTDVPAAPATVFGLSIGGGVLTTASDTVGFQPAMTTGSFRSYRVSGDATPVKLSETLDGSHNISDCYSHNAACAELWSTGDERYLQGDPVSGGKVAVRKAGTQDQAGTVATGGLYNLRTEDTAGRYVVLAQATSNWQDNRTVIVGDLDTGDRLQQTELTAAAVQGDTLWSAKQGTNTVKATDVRGASVRDSFTAPCPVTQLEAVGRFVSWGCQDSQGTLRTTGVFDTATRQTLSVPVQATNWGYDWSGRETLLGDGYLVRQDLVNGRLLLVDFHDGIRSSGGEGTVAVRTLAAGEYWKTVRKPHKAWAVDRTGPNVVWTDPDNQRVHVANNGIPTPPAGDRFTAVAPSRLLDTRAAVGRPGTDPVPASSEVTLQVAGRAGVPQTGVRAVVLNVTVTEPKADGHLRVWPSGGERPGSSNLNWTVGRTVPNQVVVPVGDDGRVKLYNSSGDTAHLIADVFGYYSAEPSGAAFTAVAPSRLLDTRAAVGRPGTDPVPAFDEVTLQVAGRAGVPQTGVRAVVLNVTVTEPKADGHLTVWPSGGARPDSSNLNWTAGLTVPNHVVVPVGADGRVKLFNAAGDTTHLIADVFGYYSDDPAAATFHSAGPKRMFDTRTTGAVGPGASTTLDLSGSRDLAHAKAVVLNVTVTEPTEAGHLTVWPSGTARPDASNLNWTQGRTVANLVTVPVGADGKVEFANRSGGSTQVIVDLLGYFG